MYLFRLLSCFLLCLSCQMLVAQCQFSVKTAEQMGICSAEEGILEIDIEGTALTWEWSPKTSLRDPFSLRPTIENPIDTTYTIRIRGYQEGDNLLVNGDFSEGDTGFTSEYRSESTQNGSYLIGKSGRDLFPQARPCEDRSVTEIDGNMLLVKVADQMNTAIYCQEITVRPNQTYHFSGFATALSINNAPQVIIKINDETVVERTIGDDNCAWQALKGNWQAGNVTNAKICIYVGDHNIGKGTDFALDDLGFYEVCEVTARTEVDVIPFEMNIVQDTVGLSCGDTIKLTASVIPDGTYFIAEWTTEDGNIIRGDQSSVLTISAEGKYDVEVLGAINNRNCRSKRSIQVESITEDSLIVEAFGQFHCNQDEVRLEVLNQTDFSDYLYQWTTTDGSLQSNGDSPIVFANQPGAYELKRTDIKGNCAVKGQINLRETSVKNFEVALTLPDCEDPAGMLLFKDIIDGISPYSYSIDGGQTFQADGFYPELDGGDYILVLEDANGCQVIKETSFTSFSTFELDLPAVVTVEKGSDYEIPLSIDENAEIESITWSPEIGLSCSGCSTPLLTNNQSQVYKVVVTDINGCQEEKEIRIQQIDPSFVFIPSAFSPNADGQNDIFSVFPNPKAVKKIKQFSVLDRYGNLVFERSDFMPIEGNIGWDGRFKGQNAPGGVYVYWVEVELEEGRNAVFRGEVLLIR